METLQTVREDVLMADKIAAYQPPSLLAAITFLAIYFYPLLKIIFRCCGFVRYLNFYFCFIIKDWTNNYPAEDWAYPPRPPPLPSPYMTLSIGRPSFLRLHLPQDSEINQ